MALKRQHIFKDILSGGSSVYHSAILTCYSFDPFFYSCFFKPQLNARGIGNQLVLIDAGRLDSAKENESLSSLSGALPFEGYTPLRIECPTGGVFHPKIGLFIGEKRVTAVIGSGNLTYSGMSHNDEAWCAFSIATGDAADTPVIAAVWRYLKSVIARQPLSTAEIQLSWMLENSELLRRVNDDTSGPVTTPDPTGEQYEFVANSESETVFSGIATAVGDAKVKSITVCAPFFDIKGIALKKLMEAFSPERLDCLVRPGEGALPIALELSENPAIRFFEFNLLKEEKSYVHAKLIQLETDRGTIIAIGSANASVQALGRADGGYNNDEADIIIRCSRRRDYLKELGIERLDQIADLPSFRQSTKNEEERPTVREVVLQGCELLEDGYHLVLSKGPVNDICLHLVDDTGKDCGMEYSLLENGITLIPRSGDFTARTVYLTRQGEQISNRCTVIICSEVERKNPDKVFGRLSQLLEAPAFSADFKEILGYVSFDEDAPPRFAGAVSWAEERSGAKAEEEARVITDQDLKKKVFLSRLAAPEQNNERILERYIHLFTSSPEEEEFSDLAEDEPASQLDMDSGSIGDVGGDPEESFKPQENARKKETGRTGKTLTLIEQARPCFNNLLKHYDSISWDHPDFQSLRKGKNTGGKDYSTLFLKRPPYIQKQSNLSYTAACIALCEMCRIAKWGDYPQWKEMQRFFMNIIGAYLLIYRDTPSDMSSVLTAKLSNRHRILVVYSLLLISFWEEQYGPRQVLLRLLTLNLFDSYRDNPGELETIIRNYRELLDKGPLPSKLGGISAVEACYGDYQSFINDKESRRKILTPDMKYAIIYRPSFGFVYLDNIKHWNNGVTPVPMIECSAIAPGFPEPIPVKKGLLRGRVPITRINASTIVFENA